MNNLSDIWLEYPENKPEAPGRYEVFSKRQNKKFFATWTGITWSEHENLITQFFIPRDPVPDPKKNRSNTG